MKFITHWINPPTVNKDKGYVGLPEWFYFLEALEQFLSQAFVVAALGLIFGLAFRFAANT